MGEGRREPRMIAHQKRNLKRNRKKKRIVAALKKNEKWRTMNHTTIRGTRFAKKVGEDLKEPYVKEVQRFLDRRKT